MLRLRKGFGSVRKLTGNRRNCYAVHPPTVKGVRPKALCYTDDYNIGVCVLNAWHNGKYYSGMELDLKERKLDEVVSTGSCTFQGVYEIYWNHKFGESAAKEYSKCTTGRVVGLIKRLYRYAIPRELCRKETGIYVEMPKVKEEEHHADFTDEEIAKLWSAADKTDEQTAAMVKMILTMIYSGFRIGAWREMTVENDVFIGGVKTDAGKNRVVPIHSSISGFVAGMYGEFLCGKSESQFRRDMRRVLLEIEIDTEEKYHIPHSCRHTFHRLLERAGVSEADRKRLMGHSLKGDITNGTYGHRSVEELKEQIEKIKIKKTKIEKIKIECQAQ